MNELRNLYQNNPPPMNLRFKTAESKNLDTLVNSLESLLEKNVNMELPINFLGIFSNSNQNRKIIAEYLYPDDKLHYWFLVVKINQLLSESRLKFFTMKDLENELGQLYDELITKNQNHQFYQQIQEEYCGDKIQDKYEEYGIPIPAPSADAYQTPNYARMDEKRRLCRYLVLELTRINLRNACNLIEKEIHNYQQRLYLLILSFLNQLSDENVKVNQKWINQWRLIIQKQLSVMSNQQRNRFNEQKQQMIDERLIGGRVKSDKEILNRLSSLDLKSELTISERKKLKRVLVKYREMNYNLSQSDKKKISKIMKKI